MPVVKTALTIGLFPPAPWGKRAFGNQALTVLAGEQALDRLQIHMPGGDVDFQIGLKRGKPLIQKTH